jgi:glyoxylase-like metal-dependent hydrolase (beta-lactamase superfamily II)
MLNASLPSPSATIRSIGPSVGPSVGSLATLFWTCLTCLILSACSTPPSEEASAVDVPLEPVELLVFDCGRLRAPSVAAFGLSDEETGVRELFVPCYVIDHPDGSLLWDGGLPSATPSEWTALPSGAEQRLERPLAAQLADLGRDLSSFDFVAFSHMHFDHVGVANEVAGATLLIQRAEHEAAFAEPPTIPFLEPELYSNLADAPTRQLDGEHDVFGDGRVVIVAAPGHTPGHQVLYVELAETGPIVLSGDLYHFRESRELKRVPTFNWDEAATRASFDKIEALLAEKGAELWIEHELAFHEQLELAPSVHR